jgi:hypothetical protein
MKRLITLSFVVLVMSVPGLLAAGDSDREAITATALDYGEGWYAGDAKRMERALHPDLAKRVVSPEPDTGKGVVRHMTAQDLVAATGHGSGTNTPADQRKADVTILEVYGNTAMVKLEMAEWIDYMQMAKLDGRWVIVNVLWEPTPEAKKKWGYPDGL